MIDLSIVIVSWNTRELLRECLASLYEYTKDVTFEVFVVDNASSDGSADMVKRDYSQVNLIQNEGNAGFSKANNQAIRLSKGRHIALLNPDTLFIEDVFSPLIRYADVQEQIGAIGPKVLCRDGKTIQYTCARRLPNLYFELCRLSGLSRKFSGTKIFGGEYMSNWDHMTSRNVEALVGACMLIKKRAIDTVGLMDENQFMYGDEIDWCKRLLDASWCIYYHADTAIIHYGGESSKQAKAFTSIEGEKAKKYYYKKHAGSFYAMVFSFLVCFFSLNKYIWSVLFRRKNKRCRELMEVYRGVFGWSFKQLICWESKT